MTKIPPEFDAEAFLNHKVDKVRDNAALVCLILSARKNRDTDVWATIAFIAGALRAMGQQTSCTTRFPKPIWDLFEKLGAACGEDFLKDMDKDKDDPSQ